ncbi:MAG: cytochrome C oxidase subunit IV family protein [Planctomyces sp.]|nr:cytochrome C oxidase subunit IV family protein [Planctomyces sp.]
MIPAPESPSHAASHDPHADHSHGHVNYLYVFVALCGFTLISVALDVVDAFSKETVTVLVLLVASAKALCVMMYFMHLKFEGNWKYIILAPTTILAIGLMVALAPDFALHYYTPTSPQFQHTPTAADHQVDTDMHSGSPHQSHAEEGLPATVQ